MKILLYKDDTIELKLKEIVECLNEIFDNIAFVEGTSRFTIKGNVVSYRYLTSRVSIIEMSWRIYTYTPFWWGTYYN